MLPVQRHELLYAWLHHVLYTLGCTSLALLSRLHSAQWTMAVAPARHHRWHDVYRHVWPQQMVPSPLVLHCICCVMCAITGQLLRDIIIFVVMNTFYHASDTNMQTKVC